MSILKPRVALALDLALIGMLTAVDGRGQPQTSPVWFLREREALIVYNRADTPRLDSIEANPRVALALRGDRLGNGAVLIEGRAAAQEDMPPAKNYPAYLEKYGGEIERFGWTPRSFSDEYPVPVRITIDRVRSWGLDHVLAAEEPVSSG